MIPLSDTRTSGRFPFQNALLILVTVLVFVWQVTAPNPDAIIYRYALVPAAVDLGNPASLLPFLTSVFLHGGLLHIGANMLFLWVFGDNVEERLGAWYIPFYLLGGSFAGLGQYLMAPDSAVPMLGASGAVAAVLGAYLVWYPHHRVKTLVPIFILLTVVDLPAGLMLAYWFVLQLFSGIASVQDVALMGGVAYFAHVAGFLFGIAVALLLGREARARYDYA